MAMNDLPWEREPGESWESAEPSWECAGQPTDSWRGESHLEDWPEELAGPEYWLYKRMCDE